MTCCIMLLQEGARPHMNDVRVINESPEQCWGEHGHYNYGRLGNYCIC